MMSWKYKGGLLLIVSVVIMWVTSAEVTQVSSLSFSLLSLCYLLVQPVMAEKFLSNIWVLIRMRFYCRL